MTIQNKATVFLIVAVLMSAIPVAHAAAPQPTLSQEKALKERRGAKMQQLFKELNLTAEQQQQLEGNKARDREQIKALFESMREKRSLFQQELQKDVVNMERLNQLNSELKILQGQMLDHRLAGILEVRKILTPEQFKKFIAKMDEQRNHPGHKWNGDKEGKARMRK